MNPRRDRPSFPESYGIASDQEGMLDWVRVERILAATSVYWVSTVRPDGTPHQTPIWGAWAAQRLYIEGGNDTVWARNLVKEPHVSVGAGTKSFQIIVRGSVVRTNPDPEVFSDIADGYAAKYPYRPEPHEFWEIHPGTILAWDLSSLEQFVTTPTRFHFAESE